MTATLVPVHSSPEPAFVPERVPAPEPETGVTGTVETTREELAVAVSVGPATFEALRARARDLIATGAYREAANVYLRSVDVATASGEGDLADEALCGWGAAETELGNGAKVMPELRRILLDSAVAHNCFLASYTLARAHELEGQIKKALFYAQLSLNHSRYVKRHGVTAGSRNLLGNLLVADGREVEAAAAYRTALRHATNSPPTWVAGAETNLGYCLLVRAAHTKGLRRTRMREGLRLIYRSIRTFRREGTIQYSVLPHLDLCFAHLSLKRAACARRHGLRALELAKQYGDLTTIKNALYLLGQVELLEGNAVAARQRFGELAQRFYPDQAGLTDVLMSVDLRQLVNLRA